MSQNQELNRLLADKYFLYPFMKKPITWSAVLSGAIVAFGLTFLFNLLTLGMGLAIVSDNSQGATDIAIGGFIWTLIGGIIILFIAGWRTGRLIKLHPQDFYDYTTAGPTPTGPGTENPYHHKVRCGCYHGMTHGFLAWGIYLIISLFFTVFIAHTVSLSGLHSSFLNIPMGIPQAIAESSGEDQGRNLQQPNQQTVQNRGRFAGQRGTTAQGTTAQGTTAQGPTVSPKTAERAGVEVIGIFLIFALGALAASVGSHLGVLYHKKCVTKHEE